jgi:predicted 3-demethylubiquinone-9 3-methyltransferase (glyoxalase superfamily)
MQKITPCLWFDHNCEEAVNFYVSLFPNSKIDSIKRYPSGMQEEHMKGMDGKILTAVFTLDNLTFQALDGGPIFSMNPSLSFFVNFDPLHNPNAARDIDAMWAKLSEGGKILMPFQEYPFSKRYGWVQDRFGTSWQLIFTDPQGEERPRIIPSLLFTQKAAGRAEEALNFYVSVFGGDSKVGSLAKYPAGMPHDKEGSLMFGEAKLAGQWLTAMDSADPGHQFTFNEGGSLVIETADQAETDALWQKLTSDGGQDSQCGWVKDKFGVSWQIVPKRMMELLSDPDLEKSNRALQAMMLMQKIDIAKLEKAFNGQ